MLVTGLASNQNDKPRSLGRIYAPWNRNVRQAVSQFAPNEKLDMCGRQDENRVDTILIGQYYLITDW